jgi:hypothetical protein
MISFDVGDIIILTLLGSWLLDDKFWRGWDYVILTLLGFWLLDDKFWHGWDYIILTLLGFCLLDDKFWRGWDYIILALLHIKLWTRSPKWLFMVTSALKLITRHYHAIEMSFFIHEGRGYGFFIQKVKDYGIIGPVRAPRWSLVLTRLLMEPRLKVMTCNL